MKKRIGVTGASGFIGNLLVRRLIEAHYEVVVFVRSPAKFSSGVKMIQGDFDNQNALDTFLQSVDTVIHLAARQLPPEHLFFDSNVSVTNKLIDRMVNFKIRQLIYLSTAAVYGDQGKSLYNENEFCSPTTKYGLTKYLAECLCQYWQEQTTGILTILRPFNIYGKGSTKGVIYNMINNLKNHQPIILFGDGNQKRDFLYVDDVVEAILLSLKKEKGGIFNLGTGKSISLLEVVASLKKIFPEKVTVNLKDEEKGKVTNITLSVKKAEKELGWKPSVTLDEGLKKCYG